MKIISRADAKTGGHVRYFTGVPCKYGHVAERTVCDYACVECGRLKARDPAKRRKRRGYMAAHQRRYRKNRPDLVRATEQKRDKAKRAADKREIRAKDPEIHRAVLRKSAQKHKAKRYAETAAWKKSHPEQFRALQRAGKANRRAREIAAEGRINKSDVLRLFEQQLGRCAAADCGRDISDNYQVDHIHPLVKGGSNWPTNAQLLCPRCNRSKGAKTMAEWTAWKAALQAPLAPLLPEPLS
jgi:5-methylcytosine-specific restriction endonuclease McrA